jgi:hypothetical protein
VGPEAVQDELDALAVRLGRGLTLDDVDGDLVAYSAQDADADAARISTILSRRVAPEIRAWEERHIAADAVEPIRVPANPALGMAARLCLPVRHRGDCLGYLWLPRPEVPLSAAELADLHRASSRFGELLSHAGSPGEPAGGGRAIDRLIRRLYEQGQAEAHSQLAAAVPALVDGTVRLVAAVPGRPDGAGVRPLTSTEFSALAAALTPTLRAYPGYVGSHVAADYALLLHRDAGPAAYRAHGPLSPPLDRLRDSLLDSLLDATTEVVARCLGPGHVCTLGISEPTPFTVRSARSARGQALTAGELAALDPALPRHSHWAALGVYRHLVRSANAGPEQVLAPLDEAGPSGPMLLLTLETYLDLGGDNQATAARLNLHRSSLYYRLNRISDLLAVPLSDGLARLELHLALKSRRAHRRTLR